MDYLQMTAPCGIDCFNCPVYAANENEKLRNAVAKNMGISPEAAVCRGCRSENGTPSCHSMTEPCSVYRCIQAKGFSFCHECSEFPCDYLHPYADLASQRPHNTKVFNLCLMKKMGLAAWAESKAKQVRDTYFKQGFRL